MGLETTCCRLPRVYLAVGLDSCGWKYDCVLHQLFGVGKVCLLIRHICFWGIQPSIGDVYSVGKKKKKSRETVPQACAVLQFFFWWSRWSHSASVVIRLWLRVDKDFRLWLIAQNSPFHSMMNSSSVFLLMKADLASHRSCPVRSVLDFLQFLKGETSERRFSWNVGSSVALPCPWPSLSFYQIPEDMKYFSNENVSFNYSTVYCRFKDGDVELSTVQLVTSGIGCSSLH